MMWTTVILYLMSSLTVSLCLMPCLKEDSPKECDFIVVGAGASGAVVASRLSEDPHVIVCLFEAGIKHTEGPFASAISIPRSHDALGPAEISWNTTTTPQIGLHNRLIDNSMGKVLGGSTTHNGMAYFRGFKADYDFWAENGAPGWDYDSVLPFFLKAENQTSPYLRNSPIHSTCGPLSLSQDPITFQSPLWKLWERTAKELSIPIEDCNAPSPFGLCLIQKTIKNGKHHSTASAYLEPALGRMNLFVVTEALVGKIVISASTKKVYGIRYLKHGQKYTVRATKEVILSGGAWETAKLLQLSGIGPKSVLQRLKIRPHVILPVGEYIQDHPLSLVDLEVNIPTVTKADLFDPKTVGEYLFQSKGLWSDGFLASNLFIDLFKQRINWPEIQVLIFDGRIEETIRGADLVRSSQGNPPTFNDIPRPNGTSLAFLPLHPKSRGTVMAKTTDPMDNPLMDPRFLAHRDDVIDLIKGIRYIRNIISESPSMGKVQAKLRPFNVESVADCFKENELDSNGFWECVLRRQTVTGHHPVGSCQIGPRKSKWAVVDTKLRVYGIKGLRVADASVMPEIPAVNTMGPAIMIGERAADIIKTDHQKKY